MDALFGEGDPLSRGQGSWLGGGRAAELYWGPQPWFRERHRIPGAQGPPPPVHREEEGEEEELKALWPLCSVLLLFCVPCSPVSTLYLNYLSFL